MRQFSFLRIKMYRMKKIRQELWILIVLDYRGMSTYSDTFVTDPRSTSANVFHIFTSHSHHDIPGLSLLGLLEYLVIHTGNCTLGISVKMCIQLSIVNTWSSMLLKIFLLKIPSTNDI